MTGELDETYIGQLRKNDDQSNLSEFFESGDSTKIAVVSDPTPDIIDYTDELIEELGIPIELLNDFRKLRAELNYMDRVEEHNSAFEKNNLEDEYLKYLNESDKAKGAVDGIVQRLMDDEDITLVCFESPKKHCHRHALLGYINQELERKGKFSIPKI